ncbi:MAG: protein-L-isoaspartate(D-aspartate) O-methyltransferase [Salinibacter sp.]
MLAALIGLLLLPVAPPDTSWEYEVLRRRMVREQIEARGVTDPAVLDAMRSVPRHRFVPDHPPRLAYTDRPLPIGHEQTISQPYIVARMTELVRPAPSDRALEIGTGSGYQAAVLSEVVDSVYTVEILPELAATARTRLRRLGYDNVVVRNADGFKGWPAHAPFDVIVVTAAPERIPPPLKRQLADGGRMIIPVGPTDGTQQLTLVTKTDGTISTRELSPVRFVPFLRNEN